MNSIGINETRTDPRLAFDGNPQVLYAGGPSQLVNLPRGLFLALAIAFAGVAYTHALWPAARMLLSAVIVILLLRLAWQLLRVAMTSIVVDAHRVTVREGVLTRETLSVELFRIMNVEAVSPWWQAMFQVGAVRLHTSDAAFPRLLLYGVPNPVQLRDVINRAALARRAEVGVREFNVGQV